MTRDEFRADKELVIQWRNELATNSLLRTVLQVMENENPVRQQPTAVSDTEAHVAYGRVIGYNEYDREFRALGETHPQPKFLKANYGIPDPPPKN